MNPERIHHELWREVQTVRLSAEAVKRHNLRPAGKKEGKS